MIWIMQTHKWSNGQLVNCLFLNTVDSFKALFLTLVYPYGFG